MFGKIKLAAAALANAERPSVKSHGKLAKQNGCNYPVNALDIALEFWGEEPGVKISLIVRAAERAHLRCTSRGPRFGGVIVLSDANGYRVGCGPIGCAG